MENSDYFCYHSTAESVRSSLLALLPPPRFSLLQENTGLLQIHSSLCTKIHTRLFMDTLSVTAKHRKEHIQGGWVEE